MSDSLSKTYKPKAIDLFSGCGGLTLGLKSAGFNVVGAIEIDPKAQETYLANHPEVSLYKNDIRTIHPSTIMKDLGIIEGELELLAGCPPCQGFSRLRTRNKGASVEDPRNDLINQFELYIEHMQPKLVMMENVPALAKDERFQRLIYKLESLSYNISYEVADAADYGVPQRRKRLILIASKKCIPTLASKTLNQKTVRSAISHLPTPSLSLDALHSVPEKRSTLVKNIISLIPKNGGSRSDLPKELHLDCHVKSNGFNDVYGRMAWDSVAPTITSGCINPSKGRFLHPEEDRAISLREASLLQGFPEDYTFITKHGKESIALMIGNALPPPFIKAHALSLMKGL